MLILPIGHDQSVYGRQWLTWFLIAINVIVFAATALLEGGAYRKIDSAAEEVERVHRQYPDARIPEEVIASLPLGARLHVGYLVSEDPEELEAPGSRSLARAAKRYVDRVEATPLLRF